MICTVILYYTLTMANGAVLKREKWVSPDIAMTLTFHLTDPASLEEAGILKVDGITVKHVEPYDCAKGPKP